MELDASLAPVFGGTVTVEHREHVTEWWYEVMGGPATGLPDDPEFRAAVMGYAEWGTRLAVSNSAHGATPAPHAPVPRWGRGVAPPYQP